MSKNAWITIVVIILIVIIGWVIYSAMENSTPAPGENSTSTATNQTGGNGANNSGGGYNTTVTSTTTITTTSNATSTGALEIFNVDGRNFSFTPSTIKVKKGDTVTINFTSTGASHDFVIDAYNVKTAVLPPGGKASVTFIANKSGSFEYYCSVSNHRAMGMVGTLIVQ